VGTRDTGGGEEKKALAEGRGSLAGTPLGMVLRTTGGKEIWALFNFPKKGGGGGFNKKKELRKFTPIKS